MIPDGSQQSSQLRACIRLCRARVRKVFEPLRCLLRRDACEKTSIDSSAADGSDRKRRYLRQSCLERGTKEPNCCSHRQAAKPAGTSVDRGAENRTNAEACASRGAEMRVINGAGREQCVRHGDPRNGFPHGGQHHNDRHEAKKIWSQGRGLDDEDQEREKLGKRCLGSDSKSRRQSRSYLEHGGKRTGSVRRLKETLPWTSLRAGRRPAVQVSAGTKADGSLDHCAAARG